MEREEDIVTPLTQEEATGGESSSVCEWWGKRGLTYTMRGGGKAQESESILRVLCLSSVSLRT